MNRREIIVGVGATSVALAKTKVKAATSSAQNAQTFKPERGPRVRVLIVNDLSGDIDGLFSTVHALLSPSTQICGIIGTAAAAPSETAQRSSELAAEILQTMGMSTKIPVYLGAARKMIDAAIPIDSPGARAIVAEAMRDSDMPLYITVGAGLTEVASALLLEPRIAQRFTLVWIGGKPHEEGGMEYNFYLDRKAAQYVFNDSQVALHQVTSRGYAKCQVSNTEIQTHVAPYGAIGAWLYNKIAEASAAVKWNTGETWTLGDSPLVALTALTSWVPSDFSSKAKYEGTSSTFKEVIVPYLTEDGHYLPRTEGRRMRVFDDVDTRLLFGDFFAKMRSNYKKSL